MTITDYEMNLIVFSMGMISMCFSAVIALRFIRSKTLLSRAVGMQIGAEFIALAATNVFAYFALIDGYNSMTPGKAALIRVMIFCTSLFTSIHMTYVMRLYDGDS